MRQVFSCPTHYIAPAEYLGKWQTNPARPVEIEAVRELLDYDPESGILTWRQRDGVYSNAFNARFAGTAAFRENGRGYLAGTILGKKVRAHRVAWAHYYGAWPTWHIDHIDGDRHNNAILNLREVSVAENNRNRGVTEKNSSGYLGVTWHKKYDRWQARIRVGGKEKFLGLFDDIERAAEVRRAAERKLGYHENHGKKPGVMRDSAHSKGAAQ